MNKIDEAIERAADGIFQEEDWPSDSPIPKFPTVSRMIEILHCHLDPLLTPDFALPVEPNNAILWESENGLYVNAQKIADFINRFKP